MFYFSSNMPTAMYIKYILRTRCPPGPLRSRIAHCFLNLLIHLAFSRKTPNSPALAQTLQY
jgi:hypothetical protein